MNPSVSISAKTVTLHAYLTRWNTTGHFPTSLEYRQAKDSELHARIVQCIWDGPYDTELTVETFPIVSDFAEFGWQQCDHWQKAVIRWIQAIPLADQLRLSSEEVLA